MSRSLTLKDLIYSSYITSSLIPIIVIELVLLALYFGVSYFITSESQKTLYSSVTQSLHEITSREAHQISQQFQEVSRISQMMKIDHQDFFSSADRCTLPKGEPEFMVHQNGVYYKNVNNGGGTLYYSSKTKMTQETKRKARCSESIDPLLKSIVQTNPIITQAYFNSWDNLNRLYPFMLDAPTQYGDTLIMQDYNFYYLADQVHNPQKKSVWTSAYLDPAGQGWMISNIVPIYNNNFLEGVSGLDVTIDSLIQNILSLKIPWQGSAFMVDSDGMILAMPQTVENILELKELKKHIYKSSVNQTISKPQEYNLFKIKNQKLRESMSKFFTEFTQFGILENGDSRYLLSQESIPETGWRLIIIVDESIVFSPIDKLKENTNMIGYIIIALMVVFYILFFSYLLRKSLKIANKIASPIEKLSLLTSDFGRKANTQLGMKVGIEEVDRLTQNFNKVSLELDVRTKEYVESQLREKMREKDAEIAYKAGLFESASSYLHNIGNTLTMIEGKILSLLDVKKALEKSGLGIKKANTMVEKSDANTQQKEEIGTFLSLFGKALTEDVTEEIQDIANDIKNINNQATISINHQQDLFNANTDMKQNYTQKFDVTSMLEELVAQYRITFNKKGVYLNLDSERNLIINSVKFQFQEGLSNALKNALESILANSTQEKGETFIRAFTLGNRVIIDISDNGLGIKEQDRPKLLKSGFTTKVNGHGLGLHSFNNFLNSHNGKLSLRSDGYLKGATLHIEIGDTHE